MTEGWVDFKDVKAAVSMEMALAHYGVELRRVNKSSLRGTCPLPAHGSESDKKSFGVSIDKNAWACHSKSCVAARDGRKGGNVLDFVAAMEGCTIRDAALQLQEWFRIGVSTETPDAGAVATTEEELAPKKREGREEPGDPQPEDVNLPLEFQLQNVDPAHPYLHRRGIKQETAEAFGVGFFPGKGSMHGRVVIPIRNAGGELVAYAGRAIDDAEPKYKLPTGFRKSRELFHVDRAMKEGREVVVVEGFFDAMKLHQAGFVCVVSLMGATLSDHQETALLEQFDKVVLMLDGDEAGRSAAAEISARLVHKTFVRVVDVPEGNQPDLLSSEEIGELLSFLR